MYKGLKKIYDSCPVVMWNMAVGHLLNIGFDNAQKIEDADIEEMEGNSMMTQEFVQDLVRTTRAIANECGNNVLEVIQFCMVEKCFDTKYYKNNK